MIAIRNHPYWWDAAEPQEAPYDALPSTVDVVVVGGGFTSLGAAIPLVRAGRRVCVVERDRPGDGASSRNGGITSGNIRWSLSRLIDKHGEKVAVGIYKEGAQARRDLYDFVAAEGIDCDFDPSGRFVGAMTPAALDGIKREAEVLAAKAGIESSIVERDDQRVEVGTDLYHGGLVRTDIGGVHPAKLHRGMRRIAENAGVTIIGGTAVNAIRRAKHGFDVKTSTGSISATNVIVATNGYTDKGLPWLRRRLVPVISEMIATEPLSPNLMGTLMPRRRMLGETRELGYYFRPSPDGTRILLGGRRFHDDPAKARERLRQGLVEIFPELSTTALTHHWFGFVAFPMDQLPKLTIGADGVIYAAGFCGSGVVWARWLGRKAAALVLGLDDDSSAFSGLPFRAIPLFDGEPWFLPLLMTYYRLKDRLARRP